MNFGTVDVDLNLAAALKPQLKRDDELECVKADEDADKSVIDLANLLKEKGFFFKWISEEPSTAMSKNITLY